VVCKNRPPVNIIINGINMGKEACFYRPTLCSPSTRFVCTTSKIITTYSNIFLRKWSVILQNSAQFKNNEGLLLRNCLLVKLKWSNFQVKKRGMSTNGQKNCISWIGKTLSECDITCSYLILEVHKKFKLFCKKVCRMKGDWFDSKF